MRMFFEQATVKQDREEPPKVEPKEYNLLYINGVLIVDGPNLAKQIPDDPSLPVGQLYIEHPLGLIDYNALIEQETRGNVSTGESTEAP
jgi:hypothetical protein